VVIEVVGSACMQCVVPPNQKVHSPEPANDASDGHDDHVTHAEIAQ